MASIHKPVELKSPFRLYRNLERGEQLVVFGDPADSMDFCSAVAFSKKHFDYPFVFNQVIESSQFGYEIYNMCKYIFNRTEMWPKLAIERNTGQATIYVLKNLNYSNLFRMVDFTSLDSHEAGSIGWVTTGFTKSGELQGTRRKMLDDFALVLKQGQVKLYDEDQIRQMQSFIIVSTGAWQVHLVTPTEMLDDYDEDYAREARQKWRFK